MEGKNDPRAAFRNPAFAYSLRFHSTLCVSTKERNSPGERAVPGVPPPTPAFFALGQWHDYEEQTLVTRQMSLVKCIGLTLTSLMCERRIQPQMNADERRCGRRVGPWPTRESSQATLHASASSRRPNRHSRHDPDCHTPEKVPDTFNLLTGRSTDLRLGSVRVTDADSTSEIAFCAFRASSRKCRRIPGPPGSLPQALDPHPGGFLLEAPKAINAPQERAGRPAPQGNPRSERESPRS